MKEHPEWSGKVVGLMVNQSLAESGLDACSQSTTLPIGQDDEAAVLWAALGATYNSVAIVDAKGKLVHRIEPVTFPDDADVVAGVVKALLK
ncbi:MAG: hypothetical protein FJ109_18825 [Deltaproteobacteria bacterium]|nr:hypothetical protein [Deltaproteobacteria bacterium]